MRKITNILLIFLFYTGCNEIDVKEEHEWINKAVAVLQPINNSNVSGIVYFNDKGGAVEIIADVNGLQQGDHGFHIHTFGDLSSVDGSSTGVIFGSLESDNKKNITGNNYRGNLGNIYALDSSLAEYKQEKFSLSLNGELSIVGRSIVIHEGEDDYETLPCGNAGRVIAVGIIGIAKN